MPNYKVTAAQLFGLSKAAPERNCHTGKEVCEFQLLSSYGVHALAVVVDAVAAALAADGKVGVLETKVCKCPELEFGGHTERRSLPHQRYRRPL